MGYQRNIIDISTNGTHSLSWEYQQYNLTSPSSASSSSHFVLPFVGWPNGTASFPDDFLVINDVKSGYIIDGDGPRVYPNPDDLSSGYPITVNGVDITGSYYSLNKKNGLYRVTYDNFYAFTIEDVINVDDYISVTHANLRNLKNSNALKPGAQYKITDFYTVYDRPDFYADGLKKLKTDVLSVTASVSPIVVTATSYNTLSPIAHQLEFPDDKITYDIDWISTEYKATPAKGRITERIDEWGNRTDYDHRTIQFKRYLDYKPKTKLTGSIISINLSNGQVIGGNTDFLNDLVPDDVILVEYTSYNSGYGGGPLLGLRVKSINSDTSFAFHTDSSYATKFSNVWGSTSVGLSTGIFYKAESTGDYISWREMYVAQSSEFNEYVLHYTFNWSVEGANKLSVSNYIGDSANSYESMQSARFLLSNNVFGGNSKLNTISPNSYNNTIAASFSGGQYWGNFYQNVIGPQFRNNIISLYDTDATRSISSNTIDVGFEGNIIRKSTFKTNVIGVGFSFNYIHYPNAWAWAFFDNNVIGDNFHDNYSPLLPIMQFGSNIFDNNVYNNKFGGPFENNIIGNLFHDNYFTGQAFGNQFGNNYQSNTHDDSFNYNVLGNNHKNNNYGGLCVSNIFGNDHDSNSYGNGFNNNFVLNFSKKNTWGLGCVGNKVGNESIYNQFPDGASYNDIGSSCKDNNISGAFNNNQIGTYFNSNNITNRFVQNIIANNYSSNQIDWVFKSNHIGDNFSSNRIEAVDGITFDFKDNVIGSDFNWNFITGGSYDISVGGFYENNIGNYFMGDGQNSSYQRIQSLFYSNRISNRFSNNTIGYIFQNNEIGDRFSSNQVWSFMFNQFANNTSNNNIFGDISNPTTVQYNVFSPGSLTSGQNYTSSSNLIAPYTVYVYIDNGSSVRCYFFAPAIQDNQAL